MAQTPSHILGLTRAAFRQEADELLTELDSALLLLEASPADEALLNRSFRAMHTLKGSGATAGYDDVSSLLHGIEDLFNDARDGKVRITSESIDLVLKVSDCIRKMLPSGPGESARHLEEGRAVVRTLQGLLSGAVGPDLPPQPGAAVADDSLEPTGGIYGISFAPAQRIFHGGNDPLVMLRELQLLGAAAVRLSAENLPPLDAMEPELCYLGWNLQLATDATEPSIRDVFLFVEDDAHVEISRVPQDGAWVLPARAYFADDVVSEFLEESEKELEAAEACVLAIEDNPSDPTPIDPLFRALHNVKGQARLVLSDTARRVPKEHPLRGLSELAHLIEGYVEKRRAAPKETVSDAAVQVLLQGLDSLKALRRDFLAARAGTPVAPELSAILAPAEMGPVNVVTASVVPPSVMGSVALQCREVLSAVYESIESGSAVTSQDLKMMTRSLDTLARAAAFDESSAIGERTTSLLVRCRAMSTTAEAPASFGADLVRDYRELLDALPRTDGPRPSRVAPPRARTVSIRPSRAPKPAADDRTPANVDGALASRTIRVDQAKLDRLMRVVGELLVARNSLPTLARRLEEERSAAGKDVKEVGDRISHIADDLQDTVMAIRMMPIRTVFQRFPRMIRDLSRSVNKQVQLIIQGEETELDKTVLEQLADPLVHLVRNAVDHGLEAPEERVRAAKPEVGTVGLTVSQEGSHVVIRIADDGRGMAPAKLTAKAVEKGLISAAEAATMSREDAFLLIFRAGFSTAEAVTNISGRGVGMDVVQNNVRQLHGTVGVESELGKGTTFTVRLPASLMVSKGILVEAAGEQYIVPIEGIREMIKFASADVHDFAGREFVHVRGTVCPLLSLAAILGIEERASASTERNAAIVASRDGQVAVVVERFVSEIDVIVKPLSEGLNRSRVFQGASILGDGRVALVMDPAQMVRNSREVPLRAPVAAGPKIAAGAAS